ncbi:MAG TPA: hypothetical protein VM166_02155 [Gemmatimonadaceae bacterium]|nr:hypothetical protein [Gemmatimonadaceae bacterium]
MTQDFEFVNDGQTFFCTMEAPRHAGMPPWWWFRLESRDRNTRYAPFAASPKDTKESVKKRILAYYSELLAIEARPVRPAYQRTWQKPVRPDAAVVAVAGEGDAAPVAVAADAPSLETVQAPE